MGAVASPSKLKKTTSCGDERRKQE
jgi:hypothetical protein